MLKLGLEHARMIFLMKRMNVYAWEMKFYFSIENTLLKKKRNIRVVVLCENVLMMNVILWYDMCKKGLVKWVELL